MPETKTTEETFSYITKQLVRFRYDPDLYIFWRNVYDAFKKEAGK